MFSNSLINKLIGKGIKREISTLFYVNNARIATNSKTHDSQLITKTTNLRSINSCCLSHLSVNFSQVSRKSHSGILNGESRFIYSCFNALPSSFITSRRYYSSSGRQDPLPRLMDFPQVAWPSVFKAIRNWILSNFIITPYFDREFKIQDFLDGSKQAVEFVSQCLASGDYDKLENVVSPEALTEIKNNISKFSMQQRADLAICKDDIFFCFPYQVGVMFNENQTDEQVQQRFVEITVCYHVLKGLQELQAQVGKMSITAGASTEFQDKVFILNYRFIREFTKGKSAEWTVNVVNHYRPSDYV